MIDNVMGSIGSHGTIAGILKTIWLTNRQMPPSITWELYIDGSLQRDNTQHTSTMGLGWFNVISNTSFSCAVNKWPSSTRAELAAIWTALLTIPSHSSVNIYTDSSAAITSINNVLFTTKGIKWVKLNNKSLLQHIHSCIKGKNLDFYLHKVKRHSNNLYNDTADLLAKGGLASDLLLDLDSTLVLDSGGLDFFLSWGV